MELNIVLVEPQIPQNTGNISRTCAVTGARLHIVKPMGFQIDDKKLKHAGLDYWHYLDITYYDGLDDFFERNKDGEFFYFTTKGRNTYCDAEYKDKTDERKEQVDFALPYMKVALGIVSPQKAEILTAMQSIKIKLI